MTSLPNYKNILLATNIARTFHHSMLHVAGLARAHNANVRVLHVVEALSDDVSTTFRLFMQDDAAREVMLKRRVTEAQEKLDQNVEVFWKSLSEEDQSVRPKFVSADVIEGFPTEVILAETKRHNSDLIVLGAHEHGINHTFLGTTAKRVLRRTDIPTLIVPCRSASSI